MNGNVTIVRKSGSSRLYISYQFNGKAVVKSTGLLDTKANRKNLQTKILEYSLALLARRDPLATAQKLSYYLDKVLENAKNRGKSSSTQATYTSGAKKALKILGDYPIADYTTSQIESMIDEMVIEQKKSKRTISTYLAPLSLAFDEAIKHKEVGVDRNPVKLATRPIREKETKMKPFTLDEVMSMVHVASGEFRKFLILAFFTGIRHGEVLGLQRGDLDIENNIINVNKQYNITFDQEDARLKTHKHKAAYSSKVPSIIWGLLGELPMDLNDHVVDRTNIKKSKRDWIREEWEKALFEAGIKAEGRTPYSTRHTFVSVALSTKVNPLLVTNNTGHTDMKMIEKAYGTLDLQKENFEDLSVMIQEQILASNIGKLAT
ncbi:tyrosine-type recombinase/integrase [Sulfuricurvum sp.]|uniref:tyrosine-type recombinase/integrase n=1 Tax=Sulfuricurvum sp. TaxID=2025608 RepID=UPI002606EACC|nr:tyrosine-type recombinase/integrase [Sulfuricurvum sp.]MDD3597425.1 tyrosine-type recombinase/integrase [Sulfuricurvum sp.]